MLYIRFSELSNATNCVPTIRCSQALKDAEFWRCVDISEDISTEDDVVVFLKNHTKDVSSRCMTVSLSILIRTSIISTYLFIRRQRWS